MTVLERIIVCNPDRLSLYSGISGSTLSLFHGGVSMHFLIKLLASVGIIVLSSQIARKLPTLGIAISFGVWIVGACIHQWFSTKQLVSCPRCNFHKRKTSAVFARILATKHSFFITMTAMFINSMEPLRCRSPKCRLCMMQVSK